MFGKKNLQNQEFLLFHRKLYLLGRRAGGQVLLVFTTRQHWPGHIAINQNLYR